MLNHLLFSLYKLFKSENKNVLNKDTKKIFKIIVNIFGGYICIYYICTIIKTK